MSDGMTIVIENNIGRLVKDAPLTTRTDVPFFYDQDLEVQACYYTTTLILRDEWEDVCNSSYTRVDENDTISYLKSQDKGETWDKEKTIVTNGIARNPMIVVNQNNIILIWIDASLGRSLMCYKTSNDYGENWTDKTFINDPNNNNIDVKDPRVFNQNNNVHNYTLITQPMILSINL